MKTEAIDPSTGEQIGVNVASYNDNSHMEISVDIPKEKNPVRVALYTTLLNVSKEKAIQAVVSGEMLAGNGVIRSYKIEDPSRRSKETHKYINVSVENRSTCSGEGKSDYLYNITSHWKNNLAYSNRDQIPFFLPMKGSVEFSDDVELYPAVPEVVLTAESQDGSREIKVAYQEMARNRARWTFDKNKVSWEFMEDWGDYVPKGKISCSNKLKLDAIFNFKAAPADIRVYLSSGNTPGQTGNFITIEYINWSWGCLAEGTHIRMADGSEKAIEDIRPGDCLRGKNSPSVHVKDISCKKAGTLVVIRTKSGNELRLTHLHPVETQRGILQAEKLNAADLICMEDGSWEEPDWLLTEESERNVYDLLTDTPDSIFANGIVTGEREMEKAGKPQEPDAETSALMEELRELAKSLSQK